MRAPEHRRHLRVVPSDPDALQSFVDESHALTWEAVGYRLRIELSGVVPAVWRQFVVPSRMTLDELHPVLQMLMGWTDSHLHQWTRRGPEGGVAERYAMRSSIEDGFGEGDRCEERVWLEEVLTHPGDVLGYEYDFGDGWEHTVVLEAIDRDAAPDEVRCLGGERSCPPEDCGGVGGYSRLLEVLADRAHPERNAMQEWAGSDFDPEVFDVTAVNALLTGRDAMRLHPPVRDSRVAPLLERIPYLAAPHLHALLPRADLQSSRREGLEDAKSGALTHLRWLLGRIGDDGITLTSSGYVPPAVVAAARDELDWGGWWFGSSTRESDNPPFQWLREASLAFGLTRKYKGRLLRTKRGAALLRRDVDMWEHVLNALPLGRDQVERDAGSLLLLALAAGAADDERRRAMVEGLTALGWRTESGDVLTASEASWVAEATLNFLRVIGAVRPPARPDGHDTPEWARGFARMALSM